MDLKTEKDPSWLDGSWIDVAKAFVFHTLKFSVLFMVVLFVFNFEGDDYLEFFAWENFRELAPDAVFTATFVSVFEVLIRRFYHGKVSDPVAEGTKAVLEARAQQEEKH